MNENIKRLANLIRKNRGGSLSYGMAYQIARELIEEGVIVPPAMVGDKFYRIYWDYRIDECRVSAITIKADKSFKIRITSGINRSVFEITPDEIGKTVFLAQEEAEKALAEGAQK